MWTSQLSGGYWRFLELWWELPGAFWSFLEALERSLEVSGAFWSFLEISGGAGTGPMRGPGEKSENFKFVIFAIKCFLSKQNLTGISLMLFLSFCVAYFVKKKLIWKFYLWTFSKLLDNIKAIFEPIDLKFGRYIVHTCITQILYGFLKILITNYRVFFLTLIFLTI